MEIDKAIEILEKHNDWRTHNEYPSKRPMTKPKVLTEAIATIVCHYKELKNISPELLKEHQQRLNKKHH